MLNFGPCCIPFLGPSVFSQSCFLAQKEQTSALSQLPPLMSLGTAQATKQHSCLKSWQRGSFVVEDLQGLLEGAEQSPATYVGFVAVALILVPRAWHLCGMCCELPQVYPRLLGSSLN